MPGKWEKEADVTLGFTSLGLQLALCGWGFGTHGPSLAIQLLDDSWFPFNRNQAIQNPSSVALKVEPQIPFQKLFTGPPAIAKQSPGTHFY